MAAAAPSPPPAGATGKWRLQTGLPALAEAAAGAFEDTGERHNGRMVARSPNGYLLFLGEERILLQIYLRNIKSSSV